MAIKRRKTSAKAAEKFNNSRGGNRVILKLEAGTTKVRILPLLDKNDELWPVHEVFRYPYKLFSKGGYKYSASSVGKEDVAETKIQEITAKNPSVGEILRKRFRAGNRFFLPVIVRDDSESDLTGDLSNIKLLDVSWKDIDSIIGPMTDPDYTWEVDGESFDVLDHEYGRDLIITKNKSGDYWDMGYSYSPKVSPILPKGKEKVLERLLSHTLEEVVYQEVMGSIPSDEEIKKLLKVEAAALLDIPETESVLSEDDILSGGSKPVKKKQPVSESPADLDDGELDLDEDDLPF